MRKILFVTQPGADEAACGVFLIGRQYLNLLKESEKFKVIKVYPNKIEDIIVEITASNPLAVIINFHPITTPWADVTEVQKKFPNIPFIKFDHDMTQESIDAYTPEKNFGFQYCISPDPTLKKTSPFVFQINRLMGDGSPINPPKKDCPWIGYQGFGFEHKGIHRIAEYAAKEFDRAILRLHIPHSIYGDPYGHLARMQVERARNIVAGTNIIVSESYHLMSSIQLVQWLSQNDVNCYFYNNNSEWGIASAPDYAIAARRPIAVTKSEQLRYVWKNVPSSIIEESSLRSIIENEFSPYEDLYKKMSRINVLHELEYLIEHLIYIHRI
jgi:hypothetical protein